MTWTRDHGPDRLYDKFRVERVSTGEPVDDFAFVLRPERDPAAHAALLAYADACEGWYPNLASQIRERAAAIAEREGDSVPRASGERAGVEGIPPGRHGRLGEADPRPPDDWDTR